MNYESVIKYAVTLCAAFIAANALAQKGDTEGVQMSAEQAKAIESWSGTLAVQAATYGAPLVAMYLRTN